MYSLFFIAKNNLKKRKGDVAVLFFLIAVSALLLYTSVSVLTGTGRVLDQIRDQAHTADFMYINSSDDVEEISRVFTSQEEVTEFELSDCFYLPGVKYRPGPTDEAKEYVFLLNVIADERNIGIVPRLDAENSILLPYYMKVAEGYGLGDSVFMTLGDHEYEFIVAGFVEDPMLSTPLNISMYSCYITQEFMEKLLNTEPSIESRRCKQYRIRLRDGESVKDFDEKIMSLLAQHIPEQGNYTYFGFNWEQMKGGTAMLSDIVMGIILIFSLLLILISLIIIRFSVRNFIEINMKNIGILQASGYTTWQLRKASTLEMAIISVCGIAVGVMIGGFVSKVIGNLQGIMLGVGWHQGFDPAAAGIVSLIIFLIVTATAYMTSACYHKQTVLDALRGGIHTHNFRKNYFPLEKSRLPQSMVFACKNIMGEKGKNIFILCIILIQAFAVYVGFTIYQNFALNTDALMKLVGIEMGDAIILGEDLEQVGDELKGWDEIREILYFNAGSVHISHGENEITVDCDMWKEPALLQRETILEGRLPRYNNEIVLTVNVAKELEVTVGDVVYVEGTGERVDYIVTGIDQKISMMGLRAMMTLEGSERLNGSMQVNQLYLVTDEAYTFEDIQKKMSESFPDVSIVDSEKQIAGSISGVTMGVEMICVVFVIITILVVSMVEMLLVKSRIVKERKNYGISKALGYTTGQLVVRTMMMNMPVIMAGAVLGVAAGSCLTEALIVACFSFSGIRKCSMSGNPLWMIVTVVGIMAVAVFAALICSIRIRKIEPVKMLVED